MMRELENHLEIIENGGVIIFPTDTVYGIGCNPYDDKCSKRKFMKLNQGKRIKVITSISIVQ